MSSSSQHEGTQKSAGEVNQGIGQPAQRRRAWVTPRLRRHGDVRAVTLGPSPGLGESGNPGVFRP